MDPVKTPDGQIVMVDPYGRVGSLPPASIGSAFAYGYRFATGDESHGQFLRNEYGESAGTAFLEGAARSASFGLYDVGARAIGAEEGVAARAALNPRAAFGGELAGFAMPLGAGALVGKAGKLGAKALLGEAAGAGSRIARGAVSGALEGGLVGVQQTISNTALADHPLGAEAILADLGSNVLFGAGVGGAVGGAVSASGAAIRGAAERVNARSRVVAERISAETDARAALSSPTARPALQPPKNWVDLLNPADFTPEEYARRRQIIEKIGVSEKALLGSGKLDDEPLFPDAAPTGWTDVIQARNAGPSATPNLRRPAASPVEPLAPGGTAPGRLAPPSPEPVLAQGTPAEAAPAEPRRTAARASETAVEDMRRTTDERLEAMAPGEKEALADLAKQLVRRKPVQLTPEIEGALEKVAIDKPTDSGSLYRGTSMPEAELEALQPGAPFKFGHLAPTSFNDDLASMYAGEAKGGKVVHARPGGVEGRQPVMFRIIEAQRGYSMVSDQLSKHLDEVLIPAESTFKVAARRVEDGVHVVDLVEGQPGYQPQGPLGNTLAGAPPRELWPRIEAAYEKAQGKLSEIEARLEKVYRRDTVPAGGDTLPGARGRGRPKKAEAGNLPDLLEQHKRAVARAVELESQVEAIRAAPAPVEPTMRAGRTPEIEASKTSSLRPQAPETRVGAEPARAPAAELPRAPTARPLALPDKTARSGPPDFSADKTYRSGPPEVTGSADPLGGRTYREGPPAGMPTPERTYSGGPPEGMPPMAPQGRNVMKGVGAAARALGGYAGFALGGMFGHPFLGAGLGRWAGNAAYRAIGRDVARGPGGFVPNGAGRLVPALVGRVNQLQSAIGTGMDRFLSIAPRDAAVRSPAVQSPLEVLKRVSYAPPSGEPAKPGPRDETGKAFAARADELARAVTDIRGTQARVHDMLAGLRVDDPAGADAVEQAAMRKLEFLWQVLPKQAQLGTPLDGFTRGQRMSDAKIHEFARYAAAAESPERLVDELNSGRLTPQTVEATKAVFPEAFSAARQALLSRVDEIRSLPYGKRVQLSILFEAPLDSTMLPSTILELQKTFQREPETRGGMAPPAGRLGSVKKSKSVSAPEPTQAQRLSTN